MAGDLVAICDGALSDRRVLLKGLADGVECDGQAVLLEKIKHSPDPTTGPVFENRLGA